LRNYILTTSNTLQLITFLPLTSLARNLFVVSLFEDHPYLVDITERTPKKLKLPTTPLTDDPISAGDTKQSTCVAIFSNTGNHIITGTSKGYINIIETESRKIIHSTKIAVGIISLLRLSSNGRSLLVNSTDRIIRVISLPDLSLIAPSTSTPSEDADPATLAENIVLTTEHKFQDLVNRLRWNHATFSHSSANSSSDYITASTYMKKDIYIWELSTNSLVRILENKEEPAIIEWHPSRPLLATTCIETGSIQIWGIEPQQKWSALAPDFAEVEENVEYVEREDEFDEFPAEEHRKRRLDREDEMVDIMTIEKTKGEEEESFVLPMLYDIENSDDEELIPMGAGTLRKKEVNEGKEWEDGSENVPNAAASPASRQRKRKQ
jgi:COMPASS component SWD1